ncbi:triose-phosphate isomerase [Geothermobacter hydrogeniphilus]|uniref:Triosephosphate isomerase n=1 Tax=Geothermobacter hydrogeniphilus TaxID=1969733 RepID=A0A2K2H769_9BACT|nr:triose-phosphate isomerase [Geothermobacter hydrogeniphilus]PNU19166.1 triose-phosphate isomerase [Geothermobacter hydrogeniphilus]
MRRPVIAGNWKMHKTITEAVELAGSLKQAAAGIDHADFIIAPVFTALATVAAELKGSNLKIAGQNCSDQPGGAFTGEVAPQMLLDAGCSHVILGHSERRQLFGENNDLINAKIKAALTAGLRVIFCIGETLEERETGRMYDVLSEQVTQGLAGLSEEQMDRVIVAYEPVWAIGTGKTATSDQAEEAHSFVRGLIAGQFNLQISEQLRILYGGSVKPGNVDELMARDNIDGALVGGASLNADDFIRIMNFSGAN